MEITLGQQYNVGEKPTVLVATGWIFDISLCENSVNQEPVNNAGFFFLDKQEIKKSERA